MSQSVEDIIFEGLVSNESFCRKVLHHLKPEYYSDDVDKFLLHEIQKFYSTHNKPPTKKILTLAVDDSEKFKQEEYKHAIDKIESIGEPEENEDWLVSRTEQFCKDKAIYNSIVESIQIIDGKSKTFGKDAIPGLLSDALSISFDKSIGHDLFDDVEKRYDFYHAKEERVPLDLDMFNRVTKGGFPKKTLNIALAGCVHPDTLVRIRKKKK